MSDNKSNINTKIKDLENANNWGEFIKKQQELLTIIFDKLEQIQADLTLNGIGDYEESYRTEFHDALKDDIQKEGRGLSLNKGGLRGDKNRNSGSKH